MNRQDQLLPYVRRVRRPLLPVENRPLPPVEPVITSAESAPAEPVLVENIEQPTLNAGLPIPAIEPPAKKLKPDDAKKTASNQTP
jgi:hypothetical protein